MFALNLKKLLATGVLSAASFAASAGDITGPNHLVEQVRANRTDVYEIVFEGRERASVFVDGDGDTDLDLYVYDEYGNEVCSDDDMTDVMFCEWTPRHTGMFTIKIENLGDVYNEYTLRTN